MASPEDLRHRLSSERLLRAAAEADATSLRRENARLRAASLSRSHYIIFVPKPRWSVWRDAALVWSQRAARWLAAAAWALRDQLWPPKDSTD